jgi:hypothetical protein
MFRLLLLLLTLATHSASASIVPSDQLAAADYKWNADGSLSAVSSVSRPPCPPSLFEPPPPEFSPSLTSP